MVTIIKDILNNFRVADLFDILIIFTMIYFAFIWFRKTSSRFILIGLGVLGFIYTLAYHFQLYLTAIVLKAFSAIILIAIVVIFQEDIRRFFERIAFLGLFKKHQQHSSTQDIDILTGTVAGLAKKNYGALIVIKGKDPLDRHLKGGSLIDGQLSTSLLESIFDPHSSGHDGAVLIEKGRIIKFGCHLPLSTNFHKIGRGGTRHMAALGLAERTDALCIVVSEERGTISIAREDKIKQLQNTEQLNTALIHFYQMEEADPASKGWTHWITSNLGEKAIALVLTCILWILFGYRSETISESFLVPIHYENLSDELMIEEPKPEKAVVTLEGPERAFFLLDRKSLNIKIDMAKSKIGENTLSFDKTKLNHPPKTSVLSIKPEKITINTIKMVKLEVPVVVPAIGTLPENLSLVNTQVNPSSVLVMVPADIKNKKSLKILTEPLDFEKIKKTTFVRRELKPGKNIYLVNGQPSEIEIIIEVKEENKKTDT